MLTIRESQIQLLAAQTNRAFEDECIAHFRAQAPELSRIVGEEGVRGVVRHGLASARRRDFTLRGPVRFYLEVMFALGSSFDTDPQLPWAARILGGSDTEMVRAERLHQAVEEYQYDIVGPDGRHGLAALERLAKVRFTASAIPEPADADVILRLIESTYPQKFAYVGADIMRRLVARASEVAATLGLSGPPGNALVCGLMVGFGHGVFEDRLYPWVSRGLSRSTKHDPEERTARLARRVRTYVDAMLENARRDA